MDKEMHRVIVRDLDNDKKELRATLAQRDAKIATLTAEIARYRLPRECRTCGAVQHGGQVLCAECAEVLTAERDALAHKLDAESAIGMLLKQEIEVINAERAALQADLDANMATTTEMLARLQGGIDGLRSEISSKMG